MIIDAHCHLDMEENPPEKMVHFMDVGGVDKIVLFAAACENLPSIPEALLWLGRNLLQSPLAGAARNLYEDATNSQPGKLKTGGKFFDIHPYPDNAVVADALKKFPDRFIGFVFLNPKKNSRVMEELEQGIEEYGMKGVKVHSWFHDYDPGKLLKGVARKCQELGLPILIHMGSRPDTSNIGELLDDFPKLKLILAHLGIPYFKESWERARKHPNVYLDISGPYLSGGLVRKAVNAVGPDKIIYGTDAPYGLRNKAGNWTYIQSRAWVENLPISQADKDKIFSGNILKLLK
jgi:predicted TIM-barrel fold metal-dependent hydrolase